MRGVEELAKDAEVSDLYTVFYRFMSLETHGHHDALKDDSDAIALCEIHLQGIGAISRVIDRHAFGGYCIEAGQTMNPSVMFWGLIVQSPTVGSTRMPTEVGLQN